MYVPPCARPENDSDDWFLERDGRQYHDDGSLEPTAEQEAEAARLDADEGEAYLARIRADNLTAALGRRRRAKDACFTECYFRTRCLRQAMDTRPASGTWGGYHIEELRSIWRLMDQRGVGDQ